MAWDAIVGLESKASPSRWRMNRPRLGGPPHYPFYTTINSEERADEWAAGVGLPAVFGDEVARRFVKRGVAQLAALWKTYREGYEDA